MQEPKGKNTYIELMKRQRTQKLSPIVEKRILNKVKEQYHNELSILVTENSPDKQEKFNFFLKSVLLNAKAGEANEISFLADMLKMLIDDFLKGNRNYNRNYRFARLNNLLYTGSINWQNDLLAIAANMLKPYLEETDFELFKDFIVQPLNSTDVNPVVKIESLAVNITADIAFLHQVARLFFSNINSSLFDKSRQQPHFIIHTFNLFFFSIIDEKNPSREVLELGWTLFELNRRYLLFIDPDSQENVSISEELERYLKENRISILGMRNEIFARLSALKAVPLLEEIDSTLRFNGIRSSLTGQEIWLNDYLENAKLIEIVRSCIGQYYSTVNRGALQGEELIAFCFQQGLQQANLRLLDQAIYRVNQNKIGSSSEFLATIAMILQKEASSLVKGFIPEILDYLGLNVSLDKEGLDVATDGQVADKYFHLSNALKLHWISLCLIQVNIENISQSNPFSYHIFVQPLDASDKVKLELTEAFNKGATLREVADYYYDLRNFEPLSKYSEAAVSLAIQLYYELLEGGEITLETMLIKFSYMRIFIKSNNNGELSKLIDIANKYEPFSIPIAEIENSRFETCHELMAQLDWVTGKIADVCFHLLMNLDFTEIGSLAGAKIESAIETLSSIFNLVYKYRKFNVEKINQFLTADYRQLKQHYADMSLQDFLFHLQNSTTVNETVFFADSEDPDLTSDQPHSFNA